MFPMFSTVSPVLFQCFQCFPVFSQCFPSVFPVFPMFFNVFPVFFPLFLLVVFPTPCVPGFPLFSASFCRSWWSLTGLLVLLGRGSALLSFAYATALWNQVGKGRPRLIHGKIHGKICEIDGFSQCRKENSLTSEPKHAL